MSYQLDLTSQLYGNREFLAHNLKGATANDDRYLFAERVPAFGVLDFGFLNADDVAQISLSANGITSPVLLRSVIALSNVDIGDEIEFNFYHNDGTSLTLMGQQKYTSNEMPIELPPIILQPTLVVEVIPKFDSWVWAYVQPVHLAFTATPNP